jgi:hypothetical protein
VKRKRKKVAVRRTWGTLRPTSRVVKDKTKYRRDAAKRELRQELEKES